MAVPTLKATVFALIAICLFSFFRFHNTDTFLTSQGLIQPPKNSNLWIYKHKCQDIAFTSNLKRGKDSEITIFCSSVNLDKKIEIRPTMDIKLTTKKCLKLKHK